MSAIHFSHASFSYSSAIPLLTDAGFNLGPGWTGLVGANGAGKSTLLTLIQGDLRPHTGSISMLPPGLEPVLCPQRVDELTDGTRSFSWDWSRDAVHMRAKLRLNSEDLTRWETLSPGERKRWQIGAALVQRPDVLLLDDPTNHLDAEVRELVVAALENFTGCGVVVSHDRQLLNALTTGTLRLHSGSVEHWGTVYDTAQRAWEATAAERSRTSAGLKSERAKLERRLDDQHRKTAKKDAERARTRKDAGKHDLDARGAIATGKHERGQRRGAASARTLSNALDNIDSALASSHIAKERGGAIVFDFDPAPKEFLARFSGMIAAGREALFEVDLAVRRNARIHVQGPNGIGKTSVVEHVVNAVAVPADRVL